MSAEPLLEIIGVTHRWRRQPAAVLDDVALSVGAGESVRIGGGNGSGKTTLVRVICGLLQPETGTVRVAGRLRSDDPRAYYRALGFLSAGDRGLIARMSVRDHLRLWASLAFLSRSQERAAIAWVIPALGLEPLIERRVDQLSLGQRQRVRIAMSCLHDPAVLVLDEPRSSLDEAGDAALLAVTDRIRGMGGAVIWASPARADDVVAFDRAYRMVDARLEASG